ncbi:hypothetical protein EV361DRAFT_313867 [Lentinula raphanica]|uniref:Uncharacterized protein n=1 Tax=Lentinula raphanica TaxID=153919 RepID=A0AA38PM04_9AGAR|nr:hypothetical protein F5878DRAFT_600314 [Lentinula raphanica]KAJ3970014.1 hypothetical protein EV361DRAFT_313867 [Lentinula raphanica]
MDPATVSTVPLQAPPIRRDMSYRKPVPEYIPSPPSSPAVMPDADLPKTQEPATLEVLRVRALPPLPDGWQDVLRQASAQGKQNDAAVKVASNHAPSFSRHPSLIPTASPMLQDGRENLPSISTSSNGSRRRLPQIVRPPTPPINTSNIKRKDSSIDNHEYLTVPRPNNLIKNAESSGLYPPLSRTATTAAGSSRNSFHPISTQASFRTERTAISDFNTGGARTNNTSHSHTDGRHEDDLHDLPVLQMYIVKPSARRRGSVLTGSTKVGSMRSQKTWSESCGSAFRHVGCAFRDAFRGCFSFQSSEY